MLQWYQFEIFYLDEVLNMTLITETPLWFVLLCILFGAGVALLLYYRNRNSAWSPKKNRWLALIRFLAITLIAFLLLNPLIKRFLREKEQPVIIFAIDNSASMLLHSRDTATDSGFLRDLTENLSKTLGRDYELDLYSFGETVNDYSGLSFTERETDMASIYQMMETRYSGRNTGALILLSDGIYNKGIHPVSLANRMNVPVYTLRWGDTTQKRDLVLAEVNVNRIAYLGNSFPLEVVVKASRSEGFSSRLLVRNKEKVFHNIPFSIAGEQFAKVFQLQMQADKEGILDYEIVVEGIENEVTLANNRTRAFIEVLTSRKQVIVLGNKPHPDIGALYNALSSNDMISCEVMMISEYKPSATPPDLIVLHQLPDDQKSLDLFTRFVQQKVPMLLIGGGKSRTELLTAAGKAPKIAPGKIRGQHQEVLGVLNSGFALFRPTTEFTDQLSGLPPLFALFGKTDPLPGEQVMIQQQIGRVVTGYPLISFHQQDGVRSCYIGGEGIWKWRLISFRNKKSHKPFDEFVNQIAQYLTTAGDRGRFRVYSSGFFSENSNITFTAELYDAALNPVVDPEVFIRIDNTDGKTYEYTFSRKEAIYALDAGKLPVGEYRYTATTTLGSEKFSSTGRFVVSPLNLEQVVTVADHQLLKTLSFQTGGLSVPASDYQEIIKHIQKRDDIKPVSHVSERFTDVTSLTWILAIILLLLSVEWFIRKREGGY